MGLTFLNAIAGNTPVSGWVSESVIDSFVYDTLRACWYKNPVHIWVGWDGMG